ncbi:cytochrome c oxidase polypeptide II [Nonlabens ulvanivorans]|uniref:Cytochrome c oxidase polypeptide II n=1 Tax=Nonlabens ulvanivorans TaxID=906888 RepID=A0A090W9F5_NONUL|nr:cytochrome c oxidase polypeptide II [Nonlabens ulvanivorans]
MTAFLIILIAALFVIALWQISKIVQLGKSPEANGADGEIANDADNNRQGKYMLYFVIAMYVMMIACFIGYQDYFLPDAASAHGGQNMIHCYY